MYLKKMLVPIQETTPVLSVLLRYTGFDYPFGIFKFFLALVVSSMYNSLIPQLYQLTFVTPCWWTIVPIPVFVGLSSCCFIIFTIFRLNFGTVLRGYQRRYEKPLIEVEQTMQLSNEKRQKNKQQSTKDHTEN